MEATKKCKVCGENKPLEEMAYQNKNGIRYYRGICKECKNAKVRQTRIDNNIKAFQEDELMKIPRKYKEIRPERILDVEAVGIAVINDDEIFVKLLDYKDTWISNYSRALVKYGKKYSLKRKKYDDNGEVAYELDKNIYDGTKWTYEKTTVEAWKLVVQEFIINYDMKNNTCCWHKGNNIEDNYYKHLYPLNNYQYDAVKDQFEKTGIDSEENILDIMNDVSYKADDWTPVRMKRNVYGVGYLGSDEIDARSKVYQRWSNMMSRCYSEATHECKPYYKGCTVCEEWLNYSNFKIWYDNNYVPGKKVDLDKDILIQNNTIYSPDTCALVTHYANTVFESRGIKTNITQSVKTGMYDATMYLLGKIKTIGSFETEAEAQEKLFEAKKDYINKFAKKSKNNVPDKVYFAMMNWKVA